jgi:hypothetical protein
MGTSVPRSYRDIVQRLQERQSVLLAVGEKLAVCRVAGIADGAAVLVLTARQLGGPMPDVADDAELTFEHGSALVVLKGGLRRRTDDQLLFQVTDGIQVPPRRRNSRLRLRLRATVRNCATGAEVQADTSDVSAEGVGLVGAAFGAPGDRLDVTIELPDGTTVSGSGPIVRHGGGLTAVNLSMAEGDDRERLCAFLLDRQREEVAEAV